MKKKEPNFICEPIPGNEEVIIALAIAKESGSFLLLPLLNHDGRSVVAR